MAIMNWRSIFRDLSKEDVKIQLKNGYLNIQATREEKKDEKDDKVNMFAENVIQEPATEAFM